MATRRPKYLAGGVGGLHGTSREVQVWSRVPSLVGYFETVERHVLQRKQSKYSVEIVSSAIQYHWKRKKKGSTVSFQRPRATCSAFNVTEATFNEEEASDDADTAAAAEGQNSEEEGPKKPKRTRRNQNQSQSQRQDRSRSRSPTDEDRPTRPNRSDKDKLCQACGGCYHSFRKCYLVRDEDEGWIIEEARETFRNNMKVASF
ncbi:hypothetical protein MMC22_005195 [Lobaria immixta]|nr:hypothetical protein [Lobaria immixta]